MSATGRSCDLLVDDGWLLTMDEHSTVIPEGGLAIDGGRIVDIGPSRELRGRWRAARTIDAGGAPVHPGMIETHTHITLNISRGAFDESTDWEGAVGYYADFWNAVSAEDEYDAARLACLELVRNGATCFVEAGTVHAPDSAAAAAGEVGVRALLADPFLWDVGGFSQDSPAIARAQPSTGRSLELLGGQLARNDDPDALVRGHVAVVGMGSASDELTHAAKQMARERGALFNQHQSYAALDVCDDEHRFGCHPLVHLGELGVLDPATLLAHVNVVRDDEHEVLAAARPSIAWCPIASATFGIGGTQRGRHLELMRDGVNVALGSDSANWSGRLDLNQVAFMAVLSTREKMRDRTALTWRDGLELATRNGARAIGEEKNLGSLEIGKRADLVIRSTDAPEAVPGLDPFQTVLQAGGARTVGTVLVGGQVVVEGGRSTLVDEREVRARAREAAARVRGRIAAGEVIR